MIDFGSASGIEVIYTSFKLTNFLKDRPRAGSTMPNRYRNFTADESWFKEGNIWHEVAPKENEIVIFKPSYGAFYDTPLDTILRNIGEDTVIICGTLTNFCCGMTARQGYERGYKVIFGSDVTFTDNEEMHHQELKTLRKDLPKLQRQMI